LACRQRRSNADCRASSTTPTQPFIDAPIKTYRRHARALGFSIETAVEPDILLLDEVLATGDADSGKVQGARPRARARGGRSSW
jgi:ABC-2 type transport system ATP-binding protein